MLTSVDRMVLTLLVISAHINFIDRGALSVAAPVLAPEFNLTPVQMGVLLSAFFWTYSSCQVLTGRLADRYEARKLYGFGFLLWSVVTALTGMTHGFTTLLILRLLLGVGESAAIPSISSILVNTVPEQRRGFANGVIDAAGKAGPAAGTFFGGMFIHAYGWRSLFLTMGFASLLWLIPWARHAPRTNAAKTERETTGFMEIFTKRAAWATFIGLFCFNYGYFFLMTWLPSYLVQERHFSVRSMAFFGALPFGTAALSSVIAGWLSDRLIVLGNTVNRVRKSFAAGGLLLSGLLLLPTAIAPDTLAMILMVMSFLGIGLFTSNVWAITQTLAGSYAAGRWTGLQNAIGNLGSVLAPMVTGWLLAHTGSFFLAFVAASASMLVGCSMYLFVTGPIQPACWRDRRPRLNTET